MARSKSLKVQNQLNNNVKCSRMLIKSCDKLPDVEFYLPKQQTDFSEIVTTNLSTNHLAAPATKQQLQNELMNSIQKKLNRLDVKNNLDKLKYELECNLKKDNLNCNLNFNLPYNLDRNLATANLVSTIATKNNLNDSKMNDNFLSKSGICLNGTDSMESNKNNQTNSTSLNDLNENQINQIANCEMVNGFTNKLIKPAFKSKLFLKNNSTALDDNWSLNFNSKNYLHTQQQEESSLKKFNLKQVYSTQSNSLSTTDHSNEQSLQFNEQTNNSSNNLSDNNLTTINSSSNCAGHLLMLCTKNYWLFTCINWRRRYCVLEDYKLIIKDNQV